MAITDLLAVVEDLHLVLKAVVRFGGEVGRPAARRRHVLGVVGGARLAQDRYLRFRSCGRLK